ncbi:MAG: hypothetical protein Q8O75_01175 [bacterium]|nr:hypothetical protein [bacterium]
MRILKGGMLEKAKQLKKQGKFTGFVNIEPDYIDYAETIASRLCLNPYKVAKLLKGLDRKPTRAYGKFFELYPTENDKILAVINF